MSKRVRNKIWKKAIIVYDVSSCPINNYIDMEKVMYLAREHGLILWDSNSEGKPPKVLPKRYSTKFKIDGEPRK